MPRMYFDVVPAGPAWQLRANGGELEASPLRYATREQAVAGAIRLARAEWKSARRATGVRVCLAGGSFHTAVLFGEDEPAPSARPRSAAGDSQRAAG